MEEVMKRPYVAPELESFGSVQKVTGVIYTGGRVDYIYDANGEEMSGGDDHGSYDDCIRVEGSDPEGSNCYAE